ncbi:MAG: hypothetical protein RLZZ46_891 [Bacteroidota bacterium]|jgi:glycosyltransferase involved in cell wall biosynthesis
MNRYRLHVLWIVPGFAAGEHDSTCIPPLQDLALSLLGRNIKLTILSLHYPFRKASYRWNNIEVICLGLPNANIVAKLFYFPLVLMRMIVMMRKNNYDLVHSFWLGETSFLGNLLSRLFRKRHIATAMGQDSSGTSFLPLMNLKSTCFVALSSYACERLERAISEPVRVIPFGVSQQWIVAPSVKSYDFIFASAFIRLKRPELFIEACSELLERKPDLRLAMVGEISDMRFYQQLLELIRVRSLEQHFFISGKVSRAELMKLLASSEVLVHPSTFDAQGLVMAEALMNSCKVVSCGAGWQAQHSGFYLTDDAGLADTMLKALFSPSPGSFSLPMSQTADEYLELYMALSMKP